MRMEPTALLDQVDHQHYKVNNQTILDEEQGNFPNLASYGCTITASVCRQV